MIIPQLRTPRLLLRGPARHDFDVYRRFYADPDASFFYGGPLEAGAAWRRLACDLGHWTLRGFGMWSVVEQATGRMVGGCGIVWPEGWPRHELTWWIAPDARRKGYASEASRAAKAAHIPAFPAPTTTTSYSPAIFPAAIGRPSASIRSLCS